MFKNYLILVLKEAAIEKYPGIGFLSEKIWCTGGLLACSVWLLRSLQLQRKMFHKMLLR
jgi:hypothetical protein